MRYRKTDCILQVFSALLVVCGGVSLCIAAEEPESQPALGTSLPLKPEEPTIYYETEGAFFMGYRWEADDDALKAAEYIYPHSSVTFGLDLLSCPLPYRYHANAEFISSYDFYTDAGFAYKDLVLFRDILIGAHHNLKHFPYQYAGEAGLTYDERNPGDKYYTDFASNLLSLRLKQPDFPFHTFASHRHVAQNGRIQQRFLLGDFSQLNKISQSRDIDWTSNAVKLGANSHLGPIELEYAYDQDKFDPGPNSILYDFTNVSRPADIYPHSVVPETESSGHTVKLHSSYTGGIVTAATLSSLSEKNNYSLTEASTWKGAFDFSWIPDPLVGLFFKYRHRTLNVDTPDGVTVTGLSGTSLTYPVREGISSNRDVFTLSTRYRPANILSLFATYEFSHFEREDVAEWLVLPGQTDIHTVNFTAHLKPMSKVKLKASYEHKNYEQPAYNTSPDTADKLRLTTTYTPAPWLNLYLEYILAMTERDSLNYLNSDSSLLYGIGERDGQRDQFLASATTALSSKLSLTASWFYQRWDVEQELVYGKWPVAGINYLRDAGVPYSDKSNSFSLSLHYLPWEDISIVAGATYTVTEGESGYDDLVGGAPFSLSSFSALKASETIFSLEVSKKLSKEWGLGIKSYLGIYDDKVYDLWDGNVITTICSLKRYF